MNQQLPAMNDVQKRMVTLSIGVDRKTTIKASVLYIGDSVVASNKHSEVTSAKEVSEQAPAVEAKKLTSEPELIEAEEVSIQEKQARSAVFESFNVGNQNVQEAV